MTTLEAAKFAIDQPPFLQFMEDQHYNINSVTQVTSRWVKTDINYLYYYVYIDFGTPGPNLGEVRLSVRYDLNRNVFIYDHIDFPNKPSQ